MLGAEGGQGLHETVRPLSLAYVVSRFSEFPRTFAGGRFHCERPAIEVAIDGSRRSNSSFAVSQLVFARSPVSGAVRRNGSPEYPYLNSARFRSRQPEPPNETVCWATRSERLLSNWCLS